ncbi:hypothetical protein J6590_035128 [Homalodisca vitripennis]|nr:hypothetical protein J6590_035128 [Homalodisca vitripennis]
MAPLPSCDMSDSQSLAHDLVPRSHSITPTSRQVYRSCGVNPPGALDTIGSPRTIGRCI